MALFDVTLGGDAIEVLDPTTLVETLKTGSSLHVVTTEESVDLTESTSLNVDYSISAADTISITDLASPGLDKDVILSDTITASDSTEVDRVLPKDAIVVTDTIQASTFYNRSINDVLFADDSVVKAATYHRTVGPDTISVVDSVIIDRTFSSDTVAVTDSLLVEMEVVRTLNDTITISDELDVDRFLPSDAVSITDQILAETSYVRTANDSITVTDQIAPDKVFERGGSDSISITDTPPFIESVFPIDVVAITETWTRTLEANRTLSDSVSVTDLASRDALSDRALSDTLTVSDTVTAAREIIFSVTINETAISITDESLGERILSREASDSITILDDLDRDTVSIRTLDETLIITEQVIRSATFTRTLATDAVSVSDQVTADTTKGRSVSDTIAITDLIATDTSYVRLPSDSVTISEQVVATNFRALEVSLSDSISMASDFVLAETINVDVEISDVLFVTDDLTASSDSFRQGSDTVSVTDTILAKLGGEVDRTASDTVALTDSVSYILIPGELQDFISIVDTTLVERLTEFPVTMDQDGYGLTINLPTEIRYDRLLEEETFHFRPILDSGVPFQSEQVEPVVSIYQTGAAGEVVYQGGQEYFSPLFRTSGSGPTSSSSVAGSNVAALDAFSIADSYKVELLGSSPVLYEDGFSAGNLNGYLEVTNGQAPGVYRIVSVIDPVSVLLDRPLPVVDSLNGQLDWKLTSAVQGVHFRTTTKVTNQANYGLRIHDLLEKDGDPFNLETDFYTAGINGPRVTDVQLTDEGLLLVEYDQEMQANRELVLPSEYTITGPTTVRVLRAWSIGPSSVVLDTMGLESGSYQLNVNYAGTPKDVAGNPIDPVYSEAIFTGSIPLRTRSIFTDRGPIAKGALAVQSGFGAAINTLAEVTLPGAALNGNHIGLYVRLGPLGQEATTSSSVLGTNVTVTDTISAPDSLKVELVNALATTTVYTTLQGTFKIDGVISSIRARLQASFTIPEASSGSLYWELLNPRNGEIADDPSDVRVTVNGSPVTPQAVIGLLGQVVLNSIPAPEDDVKIDYSWCCNPTVEFRKLNSREFRLNSWNRDVGHDANPTQHKYRYNNTLVTPSLYEPLDMLATLDQPELRELHYRAYERAYTPVLNDPTLLLLNSPIHKIAFPPAQRTISEDFVVYEATVLPENDAEPWVRHGVGATSVSAGVLTVTDNTSGVFPFGQPIFWTKSIDLTFPHAFALSWRFFLDTVTVYDGVFSGVGVGYTDEKAAYVVGFLTIGGVRKIGFLKRGSGDDPSLTSSWIGGVDGSLNPTGQPSNFDWGVLHSYRIFRDLNGVVRLFVDGDVVEILRIVPSEAPFLEELNSPFDEIQGVFFGSLSRPAENSSKWDFVRYLILPTNPLQTSPSSFVNYEATVPPEVDSKPWTPVGFHGTETVLSNNYLLLDSTSATDASTEAQVGLMGGDFRGFVRMEPLLTSASQVAVDVSVQLRTYTHGVDPYALMFAVDDGTRLTQVAFLSHQSTPKFSYGGRSLPEDFSPYVWSALGGATAAMVGRVLRITDASLSDGKVYFIEDVSPPSSDDRVIAAGTDYFLEFRNRVVSYTVDGAGFAGAFGQIFDGTRAVGVMLEEITGVRYVTLNSDGAPLGAPYRFAFDWNDGEAHTYRLAKSTTGNLVSLFIDGTFVGSAAYSLFAASGGTAIVSFGSSTALSSSSLSVVDWSYCNAWRTRSDLKHYVGIWKGYDADALTGYHLPLRAFGTNAQVVGNALGDSLANFTGDGVLAGDRLIVDFGSNKGVYEVAAVSTSTTLTIVGTWPLGPTLVDYRIVRETDWTTLHKYRLTRDSSGEIALLFENVTDPLVRVGYNSIDLPESGVGIVKTLSNGIAAIAFGSFSPENLEQSYWDFVRYGITRSPTELRIAPHHQVLNQWNVMQSPERLFSALPHETTSFKSSSTGVAPKKDPDFLADPGLPAYTQLNDSTPLVPSTQTYEVRDPYPVPVPLSVLNSPDDVLNNDGDFSLNDGTIQYRLVVPDDILYSSLDVIEQSTGEDDLLAPFGEDCGPRFSGFTYTKEVCLTYDGSVLPEDDISAPTPWVRQSDIPADVLASVSGGILTYKTIGSRTVYKNNTPLPDAPGLQTEAKFRLRILDDATLGTGDTKVRLGLSAPGLTVALAFVTTPLAERYVLVMDLNNGGYLGSVNFDFLDGGFHDYRIVRDPGAGVVRVFIDS